jgi:O-antigen ligase
MIQRLSDSTVASPPVDRLAILDLSTADALPIAGLVVASTLMMFAPLPLAGLGALIFLVVAARNRIWPLCIVVVSLPFEPLQRPIGPYAFSPTELLIVVTAAGVLTGATVRWIRRMGTSRPAPLHAVERGESPTSPIHHVERGGRHSGRGEVHHATTTWNYVTRLTTRVIPADAMVSALAVILSIVAVFSLTASVAVHESVQSLRVVILEPVIFYSLACSVSERKRLAVLLTLSLILAGVLISLVGYWQYGFGDRIITAEADLRRIRGFYGSPNNLGLFLGRCLPLALGLAIWWKRGRIALILAAGLMLGALILTFSLGAWAAVAGAVLVIARLRGRRAVLVALIAGLGGASLLGFAAVSIPRIGSHFDLQSSTSAIRLDVWRSGVNMILNHPIRGVGLDNFLYYYQHGYRLPSAWQDPNLSHPHNLVLDFWLGLGLPGPILLCALLTRFAVVARRGWLSSGLIERGLIAGAVGGMTATVVHGLVDNSFFLPDLAVLFWLMFVIVAGVFGTSSESSKV